jgi:hypothetical protein
VIITDYADLSPVYDYSAVRSRHLTCVVITGKADLSPVKSPLERKSLTTAAVSPERAGIISLIRN